MRDPIRRILERVTIDPETECWLYHGQRTDRGYGSVGVKRDDGRWVDQLAHGLMYKRCVGPVPKGFQLDHRCRVRHCVNPDHLVLTTPRENTLKGVGPTAVNALKTHCIRGHPLSGENLYVTPAGRRQCRECKRQRRRDTW